MSEDRARSEVYGRAAGRCEAGCGHPPMEWAHRVRRSQGGAWTPVNGLHLCTRCHEWAGHHPDAAGALGWEVSRSQDPADVPVWMIHETAPGGAWFLLVSDAEDDGGHLVLWLDPVTAATGEYPLPVPPPVGPPWAAWTRRGAA